MQEEKKWWKKFSAYQIVAFFLIILLFVAIIVTIGVMINIKSKTNDANKKNDQLEEVLDEGDKLAAYISPLENSLQFVYDNLTIDLKL